MLAGVLGGSILTETVFGRAGIGQITLQAIKTRDMPLVLGLVMMSALVFVVINLVVDALYFIIDPRLRRARV
jgi:peptide/nickel transport system permease protein